MNSGKVCVSICDRTSDGLFEKIEASSKWADLLEIRFDCLDPEEIAKVIDRVETPQQPHSGSLLATFRPQEQGGQRHLTTDDRRRFWSQGRERSYWGGDFEEDFIEESAHSRWSNRIVSHHDFFGSAPNVESIYERLRSTPATHIKIAIQANLITDAIPLWNLLQTAKAAGKHLIPVAMGEAGKWTRILGLAHGAFLTFAAPAAGAETAPGQISAADMTNVFRVKHLDRQTEVFGIVAGDSTYSVSPWMHNAAFTAADMNRVFIPLQVSDLDEFMSRMVKPETREVDLNFRGFSVTNPHKQAVIKHLDGIDETAEKIGAVNTVKIEDGKLLGYNTDAPGFILPLQAQFGSLSGINVSVVGAGGAARACIYALQQENANVTLFARDPAKAEALGDEFKIPVATLAPERSFGAADVLINTTPLGTSGDYENDSIATAEQLRGVKLVYDLVYNPTETLLIRNAKAAGVPTIGGLEMLISQGARQFEIWTGEKAPIDEMAAGVKKKLGL